MATLPTQLNRAQRLAALAVGLAAMAGCVSTDKAPEAPPPPGAACQLMAVWQPTVYWTPDPTRNGALNPTLAGHVWLFGQEVGFPVVGDGSLVVSLYEGISQPGVEQQPIEIWQLDAVSLRKYLKKDGLGWGYNVCLPWSTYRRDLNHIQMRVRYDPPNGAALFSDTASLALNPDPNAVAPPITQGTRNPFNGLAAANLPAAMGAKP
jgi:hypothetical protein